MESKRVKELRETYGIMDSTVEFTEEQLIELSKRRLYYISLENNDLTGDFYIKYRQVPGYISDDEKAAIFIKDKNITNRDDKYYYPFKSIKYCEEIKDGIYHESIDKVIFCATDELEFCLEYAKKIVKENIQEEIEDLESQIKQLKNAKIQCKKDN